MPTQPNPTHNVPVKIQHNPIQPNPTQPMGGRNPRPCLGYTRVLLLLLLRRARSALGVDIVLTLDVCLYVCMFVCYRSRKKTLDRNDLKLGTVVLLNSPPKPIDFGPNRFRGKGAGAERNLGPPQYLCIG